MKIYHYDSETLKFTAESDAPNCPVTGGNLLPAFATEKKPPSVRKTHVAKFVDGDWIKEKNN